MKKAIYIISIMILAASCMGLQPPVLESKQQIQIPSGTSLDPDCLFGVWTAELSTGETNDNYFEQSFRVEFQDVNDAEAIFSHWYTDGDSELADSLRNVEYTYEFKDTEVLMSPKPAAESAGAGKMRGVYLGGNRMLLLSERSTGADSICTLFRTGDPAPSITGVDKTMPSPGETVTVTGRNLQFVDHVYLPVRGGEVEVTEIVSGSKEMKFVVPEAEYVPGSVRCMSSTAHESCYSPAYMFCYDCVFFHNFISDGYTTPYKGSEFEYTISSMGTLKSGVADFASSDIPEGHALSSLTDVAHPEYVLSFFGKSPVRWEIATSTDDKDGYLRFSTADRFQYVLDNCNGRITSRTACEDLAIQMDIYVVSNGVPQWTSGYLSYRLNKDQNSLTSSMLANVAMWEKGSPMTFGNGWRTITIPLSTFDVTTSNVAMSTIGGLISSLKSSNLQTLLTVVNYPLDNMHPAVELEDFQFCISDIRLVPYKTPSNSRH